MPFDVKNPARRWKYSLLTFIYVIALSWLVASPVYAKSSDELVTDKTARPEFNSLPDRSHKYVVETLDTWAARIDSYFGSSRYDLEAANAHLRIRSGYVWDEHRSNESELKIRGKFRLPKIKDRFVLVFNGDNNEELTDARESDNVDLEEESQRGVDLQISDDKKNGSLEYRAGLRSEFKLRLSAVYRKEYYAKKLLIHFSEEPYWQDTLGFGLRTRLDTDYMLSETRQISWLNRIEYGESSPGVDWSTLLSYRHINNNASVISFYAGVSGETRPSYLTRSYDIGVLYRKNIARKWLFLEFEPSYQWRRESVDDNREGATVITGRIEVIFSQ